MQHMSFGRRAITPMLMIVLLALISLASIHQLSAAPPGPAQADPNLWITDGPVYATELSEDGSKLYIGGKFGYVGPQTGNFVALDAATGQAKAFPLVSGLVKTIVSDGRGGWYIGGNFVSVGGLPRTRLAHISSDMSVDPNWNPAANGWVFALALSPDGKTLYVGGGFCGVGNPFVSRRHVAALDATTGAALSWNPGVGGLSCGSDGAITKALALSGDGKTLYVGGSFSSAGGQTRNNLAAFDTSSGQVSATWKPEPDSTVDVLLQRDGILYVGGNFMNVAGQPDTILVALSADPTGSGGMLPTWSDPQINHTINENPGIYVTALALSPDGRTLYFSGTFDNLGMPGAPPPHADPSNSSPDDLTFHDNIAAVDAGTGQAVNWYMNPYSDTSAAVFALALSPDGKTLYAGGMFNFINGYLFPTAYGEPRNYLAALTAYNPDNPGATSERIVQAWNPNANNYVSALAVSEDGNTVYAGGYFTSVNGVNRHNLAELDLASGAALPWNPHMNDPVRALERIGNTIYAGGDFCFIGIPSAARSHLAALDGSTGALQAWNPGAGISGQGCVPQAGTVNALAASDNTIYVGGAFNTVGGATRNNLAALNSSGGLLGWNPNLDNSSGTGASMVKALAVQGPTLYAGGTFTHVGGTARSNLAAIAVSTGQASAWDPSADGAVNALALSADGQTIYAGGAFSHMGGSVRSQLAALDAGGGLLAWDPDLDNSGTGSTAPPAVDALALSGSTIYVGGVFAHIGGQAHNYLAALDATPSSSGSALDWIARADHAPALGWDASANTNPNNATAALAVSADGKTIYAGFTRPPDQFFGGTTFVAALGGTETSVSIGGAMPPAGVVGTAYPGFSFTASGAPTPTFSVTAGSLPPGLQLASSGLLHGTPSLSGNYSFTVTATNSTGRASRMVGVNIRGIAPLFTSGAPQAGMLGLIYPDFSFTASGTPAPTFSVAAGSLPPGLQLDASGLLHGTPTAAGNYTFTIMASNAAGQKKQPFTLEVQTTPPTSFTSGPPPAGMDGKAYSFSFTADGVPLPGFSLATGNLPPGLQLDASGLLHGTPSAEGSYSFTVAANNIAGQRQQAFSLTIQPSAPTMFTSSAPPDGTAGTSYSFTFSADSTSTPTFSVTAGSLPPGMQLDASGLLHGAPTSVGGFPFTIAASNAGGQYHQVFTLTIRPATPKAISFNMPPFTTTGRAYDLSFIADGTAPLRFSVVAGRLPPGMQLDTSGLLHGAPTMAGSYTFTIMASNAAGQVQQSFTMAVRGLVYLPLTIR